LGTPHAARAELAHDAIAEELGGDDARPGGIDRGGVDLMVAASEAGVGGGGVPRSASGTVTVAPAFAGVRDGGWWEAIAQNGTCSSSLHGRAQKRQGRTQRGMPWIGPDDVERR